jgi:hypothetical protein
MRPTGRSSWSRAPEDHHASIEFFRFPGQDGHHACQWVSPARDMAIRGMTDRADSCASARTSSAISAGGIISERQAVAGVREPSGDDAPYPASGSGDHRARRGCGARPGHGHAEGRWILATARRAIAARCASDGPS